MQFSDLMSGLAVLIEKMRRGNYGEDYEAAVEAMLNDFKPYLTKYILCTNTFPKDYYVACKKLLNDFGVTDYIRPVDALAEKNFVQKYLAGEIKISDLDLVINDFIDKWHSVDDNTELHDFLGFTYEEYKQWISYPGTLWKILESKRPK